MIPEIRNRVTAEQQAVLEDEEVLHEQMLYYHVLNEEETTLKEKISNSLESIDNLPNPRPLRYAKKKALDKLTRKMNTVIATIPSKGITKTNLLLKATACVISEELEDRQKIKANQKNKGQEPLWKRRIQNKIDQLRKDVSRMEELKR